jgi:FlaA1/EpsC-like NDP-sugar epimerase
MITLAGFKPDVDIKIEYTGLRPGEKLYEEVLATTENTRPSFHERIRVAQVREYAYADALSAAHWGKPLARLLYYPVEGMVIRVKD